MERTFADCSTECVLWDRYELLIRLQDAWNSTLSKKTSCVLFQKTFEVLAKYLMH